jgi:Uma2 family endonuclease
MTVTKLNLTFEQYLDYNDGADNRYELVDGELVPMPIVSPEHAAIIRFIFLLFYQEVQRLGLDWEVFNSEVGIRTSKSRSRLPDVCIVNGNDWRQLRQRRNKAAVLEAPLILAVEVVSPGEQNYERDYVIKRLEYQTLQIPEYWIIDPQERQKITILSLVNGVYIAKEYQGEEMLASPTFSNLAIAATEILNQ